MDVNVDSSDRSPADFVLFALGFIGFMVAVAGVVVSSRAAAICGGALLVLVVWSFRNRDARS